MGRLVNNKPLIPALSIQFHASQGYTVRLYLSLNIHKQTHIHKNKSRKLVTNLTKTGE